MTPQAGLFLSGIAFVGTHFAMSHPLRGTMIRAAGTGMFRFFYSIISLILFIAMVYFYWAIGPEPKIFFAPDWAWHVGMIAMWFASILLIGSFFGNPALPGADVKAARPRGVFAITRHPMMWSFAIWAGVHWALIGTAKAMVFDIPIISLALGGAVAQDRKKERMEGDAWVAWEDQTSFFPFTRGRFNPGWRAVLLGTIVFLIATRLHPIPVGLWRWIG